MEFARMDVHLDGVHQTGRTRNWPTSMRDLAVSPLLQGLENPHALFPVLGHNVDQSAGI